MSFSIALYCIELYCIETYPPQLAATQIEFRLHVNLIFNNKSLNNLSSIDINSHIPEFLFATLHPSLKSLGQPQTAYFR